MSYQLPARLAHYEVETPAEGESDGAVQVYLRKVPGGQTLVLVDVAALIWQLAIDGVADVATEVAEVVGHPVDLVGPDVETYLESLVAQGLLERSTAGPIP